MMDASYAAKQVSISEGLTFPRFFSSIQIYMWVDSGLLRDKVYFGTRSGYLDREILTIIDTRGRKKPSESWLGFKPAVGRTTPLPVSQLPEGTGRSVILSNRRTSNGALGRWQSLLLCPRKKSCMCRPMLGTSLLPWSVASSRLLASAVEGLPFIQPLHIIHMLCTVEGGDLGQVSLVCVYKQSWCRWPGEQGVLLGNHGLSRHPFLLFSLRFEYITG